MSRRRRSGVLVPLFSLTSSRSWGVGEFLDLPVFAEWLAGAGQAFVQILPITEIPDAETSPYSALTAMALDPIYISLPELPDFQALGGELQLADEDRALIEQVRASPRIEHRLVRALKARSLRRAYERFEAEEIDRGTARAEFFANFVTNEAQWLDDYAIFQALRGRHALRPWWEWPAPLAARDAAAMTEAEQELGGEIQYRKYVQWVAAEQWASARRASMPIEIFGDIPFMISADSPDVWTRQPEFRFDATVGVPPDAFSETGQDWGLPPWRWDVMADGNYEWMRRRAMRSARLFDGFRLDHLVGFYRTFIRPLDVSVKPFFAPPDERRQIQLGERLVRIYLASGAEVVAEDLGTVPDFVRLSLLRLGVPGFKVFRWERHWWSEAQPFIDPADYPEASVATTGTHDTETLVCWWEELGQTERDLILQIPLVARFLKEPAETLRESPTLPRALHQALLRALLEAGSRLTIIPMQDLFGWRERVNTPAHVGDENWTWRLPWPVDRLWEIAEARDRAIELAYWTHAAGR